MTEILTVKSPSEIARVATLATRIWREHYTPIVGPDLVDYMLRTFQSAEAIAEQIASEDYHYVLVQHNSNDAGYAATLPSPTPGTLRLSKIYVDSAYRGNKLGEALLNHAVQRATELGCSHLDLTVNKHNDTSIAWYQHHKFEISDSIIADIGHGFVMDDYIMRRKVR